MVFWFANDYTAVHVSSAIRLILNNRRTLGMPDLLMLEGTKVPADSLQRAF